VKGAAIVLAALVLAALGFAGGWFARQETHNEKSCVVVPAYTRTVLLEPEVVPPDVVCQ
jgi:hypothetical protein